jgi:phage gpG-like protein
MSNFLRDLRIIAGELNALVRELPRLAGAEVLESIDDNFRSQAFFGAPWAPRQRTEGNEGKAILVQSGRLRRSFELETRGLTLIIRTDAPYAQVHNEGGVVEHTITITPQMRKFFWAKFRETKDEMWKGMALTKKGVLQQRFTMPQRQFMGEHPQLDERLENLLETELNNIFGN